jgi:4-hydroxybenzoate polyprenyltransferase
VTLTVRRTVAALAVAHPVPSALNAVLVAALASVAGAGLTTALLLALAMLGFQLSIGALNDIVDAEADAERVPPKPIPAGLVPVPVAASVVVAGAATGLIISASFSPAVLLLGALGYLSGVAYDLVMRRRGLGWLCLAAALPLLLAWTWVAAAQILPPGWPFLLSMAALSGPALHLANSLVDVDEDRRAGRHSLATRWGPARARSILAVLMTAVLVLAWTTLLLTPPISSITLVVGTGATVAAATGVSLSWSEQARWREAGWLLQAVALAGMAVAWLASTVAP